MQRWPSCARRWHVVRAGWAVDCPGAEGGAAPFRRAFERAFQRPKRVHLAMNFIWQMTSLLTANLVRTRGPTSGDSVYLTFDDGPDPAQTDRLLALLARHNAKASFFLIGERAEASPDLVVRILAGGHAVGNHSMTHQPMRQIGTRAQLQQIDQADAVLQRIDGNRWHAFRPPNGRVTWVVLLSTLWRRRPLVLWSIDSMDYKLDHQAVVERLRAMPPRDGDIILFHDDGERALLALEVLLPEWERAGLRFPPLECAG